MEEVKIGISQEKYFKMDGTNYVEKQLIGKLKIIRNNSIRIEEVKGGWVDPEGEDSIGANETST